MNRKVLVLNEIRAEQEFCDTLIKVGPKEFHAHKIILSSCCPYFRALFTRWSPPDRRVFDVSDVSPQIMELIIDYAYTHSLAVTEKNVEDLFIAADRLNILGIIEVCVDLLEKFLSPLNCIGIWKFAQAYSQPELRDKAFLFLLVHFAEVVETWDEFRDLSIEELERILESDWLNAREERTVYEAILHWIEFSPEERQQHLSSLLSKVRLGHLSEDYIRKDVLKNPLMKTNRICERMILHRLMVMRQLKRNPSSTGPSRNLVARPRLPPAIILAVGGKKKSVTEGYTNVFQAYDSRADRWVNVLNTNGPIMAAHGLVFLNGFVYGVGGRDNIEHLNTVHRFDPDSHTWQEVAPMHSKRSSLSVTVLDGCIYAVGGFDGRNQLATVEVYRPETNQWTEITPMHDERGDSGCVAFNGKVYVCGGVSGWQIVSSAESYDPHTDQWTRIANLQRFCRGIGVIAYANRIFAVGGSDGNLSLHSVESYDPDRNTWQTEAPMLNSRSNFGIAVIDNRIFVVGGVCDSVVISHVECYDAETNKWSNMCNLGNARSTLSCCVVHGLKNLSDYAVPRDVQE